jgi:hypothetical protein
MPILQRIRNEIDTYRRRTGKDPARVVLSPLALQQLMDEGDPFSIVSVEPGTIRSTVYGIPLRTINEAGTFVAVSSS